MGSDAAGTHIVPSKACPSKDWPFEGTVIAAHDPSDSLLDKRVFLTPHRGWESGPAPTTSYVSFPPTPLHAQTPQAWDAGRDGRGRITARGHVCRVHRRGSARGPRDARPPRRRARGGMASGRPDSLAVRASRIIRSRQSDLGSRAAAVHGQVRAGDNVLVTGIGGGVALLVAQLAVARGANVFVTSGSDEKILRAVALGVRGGVNYRSSASQTTRTGWDKG
jgi:antitoxin (DNA-binding transcriptional repressor) of toxin-antitoxin stability system